MDATERLRYNQGAAARPAGSSTTLRAFAAAFAGSSGPPTPPSHQKQMRTALNGLEESTPGLLAAWDEAMRRWKELSSVIFSRVAEDDSSTGSDATQMELIESSKTPEVGVSRRSNCARARADPPCFFRSLVQQQQFEEWSNLSGFLLAGSGVCTDNLDAVQLDAVIPAARYPSRFFTDRSKQVDRLIQELVDLLGAVRA
jgi:hypothetical protein